MLQVALKMLTSGTTMSISIEKDGTVKIMFMKSEKMIVTFSQRTWMDNFMQSMQDDRLEAKLIFLIWNYQKIKGRVLRMLFYNWIFSNDHFVNVREYGKLAGQAGQ